TARSAIAEARLSAGDIAAIGITNQRETTIVWDRSTGQPIHNAIVWQDRRTAGLCESLRQEGHETLIRESTGLVTDPYFSATKIRWLLDNVPGARGRAEAGDLAFGTVDTWLIWQLTGGRSHVTDRTNASRTMLFNLAGDAWDDGLLSLLAIPPAMLPTVMPSAGIFAETDPTLLGAAIPIAGVAGDQQAALFGQACFEPGEAKNTYGTGSFALMHTGASRAESPSGLLTTAAASHSSAPVFALEGSIFVTGSAVQWLRDGLGIIRSASEVEALAGSVPDSGGALVVPAFAGLGAPHWDPHARGTILGITRGTSAAHIARATLEAIAHQVRDVIELMESDSGVTLSELRVDGGAAANDLLMQIQADLLGRPVLRPAVLETTARGAAYLAGLASGVWKSLDELRAKWVLERRFEPTMAAKDRSRMTADWRRAVERSRDWAIAE
ncbi:MAG TPA: glycerol kinase GlpK, partial [Dehalococcoidia bacterium]|nr:glycerol kinase GlpK [Dehalococcoidia bacterium]